MLPRSPQRLLALDFLRGIAVLLVLCRHYIINDFLFQIGWIGVDLFFVLSGFLVTGLLFKEYQKDGRVNTRRFFIRRGFKIYPAFYVFWLATLIYGQYYPMQMPYTTGNLLGEALFFQNYDHAMWYHTWSLGVEEHFYILLTLGFPFIISSGMLRQPRRFYLLAGIVIGSSILLRILFFFYGNVDVTYTHFRLDSFMAGALLAYLFHLRVEQLQAFLAKYQWAIWTVAIACLVPAGIFDGRDGFMKTIGLSLLYTGFGLILIQLVANPNITSLRLPRFAAHLVRPVAFVGVYSYSIYLWHMFVRIWLARFYSPEDKTIFWLYLGSSIMLGVGMALLIEFPVLRLREKLSPPQRHTAACTRS